MNFWMRVKIGVARVRHTQGDAMSQVTQQPSPQQGLRTCRMSVSAWLALAIGMLAILVQVLSIDPSQRHAWLMLPCVLLLSLSLPHLVHTGRKLPGESASPVKRPGCDGNSKLPLHATQDEKTRQAHKMEAIGRLAGGVAHDFNNLLTIINGYSEILLETVREEGTTRQMIQEIRKAGDRAASLTRQLLAFSRKQMLQPRVVNINALVQNLDTMLRRLIGENIDLVTNLAPDPLAFKVDPGQIEQALTNLVINARDAMPKGGRITITTGRLDLAGKPLLLVTVTDTGHGMDEAIRAHLFEPFFTTKELGKGTGLGLSTVYGIVEQSGGHIDVLSAPGRGTTFKLLFPLVAETPDAVVAVKPPKETLAGSETILLVEDEAGIRKLACQSLEQLGYTILEAGDGIEALNLCKQYKGRIDVVVTDVVMPFLSGVELVEHLVKRYPRIKSLFVSGYTDSAVVREGVQDMTLTYLTKPFATADLMAKIRLLLDDEGEAA
jgi:signal transduction histidine kinase/ActR/RegA family two-component response regulator